MSLILNGDTGVSMVQDGSIVDADLALTANSPSIKTALNASGNAPIFGCRAWVNFNGTRNVTDTGASTNGQPVKIRASGNVTSVVKEATGVYTVNFTTAMPDANYCISGSAGDNVAASGCWLGSGTYPTLPNNNLIGSCRVLVHYSTSALTDTSHINIAIFR